MKKMFLMLMLISVSGFAQKNQERNHSQRDKMTVEERAEVMTERLTRQLDLTAEQQAKVKQLYLERAQKKEGMMGEQKDKMKEAKEKMKDRRQKMREEMITERKENREQLKAILTEDQFQKFEQIQKDRKKRMQEQSGGWKKDKNN